MEDGDAEGTANEAIQDGCWDSSAGGWFVAWGLDRGDVTWSFGNIFGGMCAVPRPDMLYFIEEMVSVGIRIVPDVYWSDLDLFAYPWICRLSSFFQPILLLYSCVLSHLEPESVPTRTIGLISPRHPLMFCRHKFARIPLAEAHAV